MILAEAHLELVLAGVLLAVGLLLIAAYSTEIPYPILLVVGGAGLGFVPGVPDVQLDPDLVLLILLPPLLYSAAFFSSLRDLQANVRAISLLSVGLVLFTTVGIAVVGHELLDLSWPVAFALGAIVSPTDPVAAAEIGRRVGAPHRVITVIEGESLINDSTGLIAYKFAVAAVVSGSFSLVDAGGRFLLNAVAGVALGLALGYVIANVRRAIDDAPTEITISITTPYFAYLPAEALGISAVLAAVSCGIYLGWNSPTIITPNVRIQTFAVWEVLAFLLNAALFTLVGLQLPQVLDGISGVSTGRLIGDGAIVLGAVIAIRFLWVFPAAYLPRVLIRRWRERDPMPRPSTLTLVAWSGMRGAVSLAAALALPRTIDGGGAFPDRDLLIYLVYCVIAGTLLVQGLTLPWLIRWMGIEEDGKLEYKENKARVLAAQAALDRLEELREAEWTREETIDRVRGQYEYRRNRFATRFDEDASESEAIEERSAAYQRLMRELYEAQRAQIVAMRNAGRISDDIMHRIERDLDLEDSRLEV